MLKALRKGFFWLCAGIGFFFLFLAVAGTLIAFMVDEEKRLHLPKQMVLQLDLEDGLIESESNYSLIQLWREQNLSLRQAVDSIRAAASDKRVNALLVRANGAVGLSTAQELRQAVLDFRKSGKKAYAFGDSFGVEGAGGNAYYLSAAFDEIWMQPSGDWGFTGILIEVPFVRGLLDKIGVAPNFSAREEYKTVMNFMTEKKFTKAERESYESLAQNIHNQRLRTIAVNRNIELTTLDAYVDEAPLTSGMALARNLVDTLGYWPQLRDKLREAFGEDMRFVALYDYGMESYAPASKHRVALIYGVGEIIPGKETHGSSFDSGMRFYADDVAYALRDAALDDDIDAILLRINSPGGSYVASDTVWQAVMAAKDKKPVIAFMGDVAASGGYFVAMAADKIIAQPGTITGSIGVAAGKPSFGGLLQKLDVTVDRVQIGKNADMWSLTDNFTPAGRQKLEEFLDISYADFVRKMADARGFSQEEARTVAKGRVWTGEEAFARKLVDRLGGWPEAYEEVRAAIGAEANAPLEFIPFPEPRPPIEDLIEILTGYSVAAKSAPFLSSLLKAQSYLPFTSESGTSFQAPRLIIN